MRPSAFPSRQAEERNGRALQPQEGLLVGPAQEGNVNLHPG